MENSKITIVEVSINELNASEYNPRKWDKSAIEQLTDSVERFGLVDPLICNSAPGRENIVIGGHFRLKVARDLGYKQMPVVYLNIPDLEKEKELNIRLNKNLGEFNLDLLKNFDEDFLKDIGFSSEELDDIFPALENPEVFDLEKELEKLDIESVSVKPGDVYRLGPHRLMCGDSTNEADMLALMDNQKADLVLTDPPYILNYLKGKKKNSDNEGFGYKRDRHYIGTDTLPDNFTELWISNVAKVQKLDFHIICYENWKNLRTIWNEMEKHWKVKNMIVWHLPNRTQGFSAKYKFFFQA